MAEYLVTGGTSFIASHVIKKLLELGHSVRTTVRDSSDEKKVGFLWELKGAKERLKIFEADLTVEGSFDEAVNGVDGVFHIASRVTASHYINNLLVDPDVSGTMNLMNACATARNTVRRIVFTSSSTSIRFRFDATQVAPLNETHWSDPDYCKRFKLWYGYAKTLGEKEAWRIAAEKKLNLVVVIPTFSIGPTLSPKPTSTALNFLSLLTGVAETYPNFRGGFVHVEDVAAAHILAMEEPKASGRIICSSSVAHWSEIIEMLRTKCGSEEGRDMPHNLDTTKIRKLGFASFKSLAEMFDDCIRSFQDKGLL